MQGRLGAQRVRGLFLRCGGLVAIALVATWVLSIWRTSDQVVCEQGVITRTSQIPGQHSCRCSPLLHYLSYPCDFE